MPVQNYENLERPYDSATLARSGDLTVTAGVDNTNQADSTGVSGGTAAYDPNADMQAGLGGISPTSGGAAQQATVPAAGALEDVWIKSFIRSVNWQPKSSGFTIDGQTGYAEFTNVFISGPITATSGTIGGWSISATELYSGNVHLDSANEAIRLGAATSPTVGIGVFIGSDGAAGYDLRVGNPAANYMWWDASAATLNVVGTISGRSTATIASAIDVSGNLITDLINVRLDTSAKTMLSDFSFGASDYSGALKSGTITWNTTTGAITGGSGVLVYRGGIIGAAAGVATFTIDATTGAATFAGTLSAPTGTIGSFTIGTYLYTGTKTAYNDTNAGIHVGGDGIGIGNNVFTVSSAGAMVAKSGTIAGWTISTTAITSPNDPSGFAIVLNASAVSIDFGGGVTIANTATPYSGLGGLAIEHDAGTVRMEVSGNGEALGSQQAIFSDAAGDIVMGVQNPINSSPHAFAFVSATAAITGFAFVVESAATTAGEATMQVSALSGSTRPALQVVSIGSTNAHSLYASRAISSDSIGVTAILVDSTNSGTSTADGIKLSAKTDGIKITSATTGIRVSSTTTGIVITSATTGIAITSVTNGITMASGVTVGYSVNASDRGFQAGSSNVGLDVSGCSYAFYFSGNGAGAGAYAGKVLVSVGGNNYYLHYFS